MLNCICDVNSADPAPVWCHSWGDDASYAGDGVQGEERWTTDRSQHDRWRQDKHAHTHITHTCKSRGVVDQLFTCFIIPIFVFPYQGLMLRPRWMKTLGLSMEEIASTAGHGWTRWERVTRLITKESQLHLGTVFLSFGKELLVFTQSRTSLHIHSTLL